LGRTDAGRPGASAILTVSRYRKQKADVAEHPEAFDHVGLLVNGLPGEAELPLI